MSLENEVMPKVINFYLLLEILVKTQIVKIVKNFLIKKKNCATDHLKTASKRAV